jgi:hypothetical protein
LRVGVLAFDIRAISTKTAFRCIFTIRMRKEAI